MSLKGLDLSTWNVVNDYAAVAKDDVDFVILKIMGKDLNYDKRFLTHWNGFTANDVTIQGVYNYTYATTVQKFRTDAIRLVELMAGRKCMVWLDVEDKILANLGETLINGIFAFKEEIEKAGLPFGIYTYISFYNSYMKKWESRLQGIPFWIARYPSTQKVDNSAEPNQKYKPVINQKVYGWQYSSTGYVNGITGNVDLNTWYVDIAAKDEVEHKKTVDQLVQEILDGKYGTGAERKAKIEAEGYDYRTVQDAVNAAVKINNSQEEKLEPVKIPMTTLVNDIIDGKYGVGETRKSILEGMGYNFREVQDAVNAAVKSNKETKVPMTTLVNDVIAGKYGNGEERKVRIESMGYNYSEVQKEVNAEIKRRQR